MVEAACAAAAKLTGASEPLKPVVALAVLRRAGRLDSTQATRKVQASTVFSFPSLRVFTLKFLWSLSPFSSGLRQEGVFQSHRLALHARRKCMFCCCSGDRVLQRYPWGVPCSASSSQLIV